jgi:hypothetical protein
MAGFMRRTSTQRDGRPSPWIPSLIILSWGPTLVLGADPAVGDKQYTPLQRMELARLKACHDYVLRLRSKRRDLPPRPGQHDFRAIFHAHAEDSAHTGGTRPEMLEEAKRAGVAAIFLSDHYRPPRDFITESWRGVRDGVLFVPGLEVRGFLVLPTRSIMVHTEAPLEAFVREVRADDGLIFLSHIEERRDHPTGDLDGMEITNRHYDAKRDAAGLVGLMLKLTDPDSIAELETAVKEFPDELFATQLEYPTVYLDKWDAETKTHRLTGVAANDCHHNNVLVVKMVDAETVLVGTNVDRDDQMRKVTAAERPGVRALTEGHRPGDVLARVDIDPYRVAFRNVCTHVAASALDEPTLREAVRAGHVYVGHDWMGDPTGFRFEAFGGGPLPIAMQGDRLDWPGTAEGPIRLRAEVPIAGHIRLIEGGRVIATLDGDHIEHELTAAGTYRVECWLDLDGERRPWVYSNPIYVGLPRR